MSTSIPYTSAIVEPARQCEVLTLASLEQDLLRPLPPEEVKFLPKSPRKNEQGKWVCLALPYADKRAYEDRLNECAFGHWSTPYNPPFAVGNKLVVPVTVMVCGVAHTDYGEKFLTSLSRKGEMREEENSATEAYSQGFRRACAQFRLGRYFYNLPKMWVPYDPTTRMIALSGSQKQKLVLQLYTQAGFLSRESHETEPPAQEANKKVPEVVSDVVTEPVPVLASSSEAKSPTIKQHQRQWLEQQLNRDEARIQRVCFQYQVETLDQLSNEQYVHLTNRIFASQKRRQQATSSDIPQSSPVIVPQHKKGL